MNDDTGVPAAVFALKPEWADLILSGAKTVEIRRARIPKNLFDEYAKGADRLYAYRLENPIRYGKPKTLSDIGLKRAPQSWCYLPETGPAGPEPAMEGLN